MVQATIAPCRAVVRELESAGVPNVVHVPLGVDLELFTPARRAGAEATRRRLGLPEGPLALYVGRFAGEKELDLVLGAWAAVERRTGARLVLVGAGPAEASLRRAPGADRAIWLGFERSRERLADLYGAATLYVAPGPAETFGLSAMEALASGLPIVSVDQGGVAEAVSRSGAGRLYAAGDPAHFVEVAGSVLAGDPAVLGATGRAYAEAHHAWPHVFDRLFEVYAGILGG
jgi:alpha-1,6-mannosyltransferase